METGLNKLMKTVLASRQSNIGKGTLGARGSPECNRVSFSPQVSAEEGKVAKEGGDLGGECGKEVLTWDLKGQSLEDPGPIQFSGFKRVGKSLEGKDYTQCVQGPGTSLLGKAGSLKYTSKTLVWFFCIVFFTVILGK